MATQSKELVVNPNMIAENLNNAVAMIDGERQDVELAKKIMRRAAANVRLLFELSADPESGQFRLQNYGQAWMLADLMFAGDLVPPSYKKPEQVVIALMKCSELNVSPITGLGNMMVINNRVSVWGDLAQALVERTGQIDRQITEEMSEKPAPMLELDRWPLDYGWRVSTFRKGQDTPYIGEYTVADARRAGLWMNTSKKPWITDPGRMLFNRARARSLRDGFADCLYGMGIIEEQADFEVVRAPMQLTDKRNLADDEPETEPMMPDYEERGEPKAEDQPADTLDPNF